ncbi:MAG: enamine deaminase RidA (YjgF/YER057c/UK114 family) [Thermoproteota archaeon]|jgi:enamine deaminase RidA (YjgF/YER057c/UK114 family)
MPCASLLLVIHIGVFMKKIVLLSLFVLSNISCASEIKNINPKGLYKSEQYAQVTTSTKTMRIYISGQISMDVSGAIVGEGNLRLQTKQVFLNLEIALKEVNADFKDIVNYKIYIVGLNAKSLSEFEKGAGDAFEQMRKDGPISSSTLIGVQGLINKDMLIEIEAIAEI